MQFERGNTKYRSIKYYKSGIVNKSDSLYWQMFYHLILKAHSMLVFYD
jgi:hypothetical protein